MNKEIEKYIWYYLGVYVVVLLTFAAFQYFGECDGASLNCKTNWEKVKDILQTTAYMLTPIIAIIGFINWRDQELYKKSIDIIQQIHEKANDLLKQWTDLRDETYCNYTLDYSADIVKSEFQDANKYLEVAPKIKEIFDTHEQLIFLTNILYFNKTFDNKILDENLLEISEYLEKYRQSFLSYRMNIRIKSFRGKYFDKKTYVRKQLDILSSFANNFMDKSDQLEYIDHDKNFRKLHTNLITELKNIRNSY